MSDPLRNQETRAPEGVEGADAKIEQLLLVGLDHYFAAEYDQAINVWTRALFIDRSHARARAYIERARSALAERQRQSEELLQNGVAAFQRGEGDEARRLLQAAIDGGAPSDEALAVLDRLNRLEVGAAPAPQPASPRRPRATASNTVADRSRSLLWVAAWMALLAVLVMTGIYTASAWRRLEWRSFFALPDAPTQAAAPVSDVTRNPGLPLPRRGETALARARALAGSGRLREALTVLDLVHPTDSQKADADRLRADIQRQILTLAGPQRTP
jgi:tetratricopeptide (TPR) repeat protein